MQKLHTNLKQKVFKKNHRISLKPIKNSLLSHLYYVDWDYNLKTTPLVKEFQKLSKELNNKIIDGTLLLFKMHEFHQTVSNNMENINAFPTLVFETLDERRKKIYDNHIHFETDLTQLFA
jgi:hypothetical protein